MQCTPPSILDAPILGKWHSTTLLASALRKLTCGRKLTVAAGAKTQQGMNTTAPEREREGEGLPEKELRTAQPEAVDLRAPQLLQHLSATPGLGWGNMAPFYGLCTPDIVQGVEMAQTSVQHSPVQARYARSNLVT